MADLTFNELLEEYSAGNQFIKLKTLPSGALGTVDAYKECAEELLNVDTCDGKKYFHIPDLFEFFDFLERKYGADVADELKNNLIDYYNKNMGGSKANVSDETKLIQASMQDTMMAGFNISGRVPDKNGTKLRVDKKDELNKNTGMQIYMGNMPQAWNFKTKYIPAQKTLIKNNEVGSFNGCRLLYQEKNKYQHVEKDFVTRVQGANNVVHIKGKRAGKYVMTPYYLIEAIINRLVELSRNNILEITQKSPSGNEKVRAVTTNAMELHKANDVTFNEPVATNRNCISIGRVFLPILGVTALSRRTEQIDVARIEKIALKQNFSQYAKQAEEMRGNPQEEMDTFKMETAIYALSDFCTIWKKHPEDEVLKKIGKKLGIPRSVVTDDYLIFLSEAVHDLHGSKTKRQKREITSRIYGLHKMMDLKDEIYGDGVATDAITKEEILEGKPTDEIRDILNSYLKEGVCRVEMITSNQYVQNVLCTKNNDIIDMVYGKHFREDNMSYKQKVGEIVRAVHEGITLEKAEQLLAKRDMLKYFDNDAVDMDDKFDVFKQFVDSIGSKYATATASDDEDDEVDLTNTKVKAYFLDDDDFEKANEIIMDGYPKKERPLIRNINHDEIISATRLYSGLHNLYSKNWQSYQGIPVDKVLRIYRII